MKCSAGICVYSGKYYQAKKDDFSQIKKPASFFLGKELIAAEEAKDQECLAAFGSNKPSLFRIKDAIKIDPSAIQVGIVRAKQLKNMIVVLGIVISRIVAGGKSIYKGIQPNGRKMHLPGVTFTPCRNS